MTVAFSFQKILPNSPIYVVVVELIIRTLKMSKIGLFKSSLCSCYCKTLLKCWNYSHRVSAAANMKRATYHYNVRENVSNFGGKIDPNYRAQLKGKDLFWWKLFRDKDNVCEPFFKDRLLSYCPFKLLFFILLNIRMRIRS